jgi:hypothetical protein
MSAPGGLEFQQNLSPQRDARRSMPAWYDRLTSVQLFVISHERDVTIAVPQIFPPALARA